jgi:hypothetical protein
MNFVQPLHSNDLARTQQTQLSPFELTPTEAYIADKFDGEPIASRLAVPDSRHLGDVAIGDNVTIEEFKKAVGRIAGPATLYYGEPSPAGKLNNTLVTRNPQLARDAGASHVLGLIAQTPVHLKPISDTPAL